MEAAAKKALLKPPRENGEILLLPEAEAFSADLRGARRAATCHQLAFFHPGIAIRFHLINALGPAAGRLLFMDTDRTLLQARIPCREAKSKVCGLVSSERALYRNFSLGHDALERFFTGVGEEFVRCTGNGLPDAVRAYERYVRICLGLDRDMPLRERLAESFVRFSGFEVPYRFLSDLFAGDAFRDFFLRIFEDARRFREVYNRTLHRYKELFRFRFRNFPFPELKSGELPFWMEQRGVRCQFTVDGFNARDIGRCTILPKASPLTLFLRMHYCDLFVHGVGGANYEWVNDRIAEEFFGVELPPWSVLSATFHLGGIPERDYPFFFMAPREVKRRLKDTGVVL
jgi:hypothetical protein